MATRISNGQSMAPKSWSWSTNKRKIVMQWGSNQYTRAEVIHAIGGPSARLAVQYAGCHSKDMVCWPPNISIRRWWLGKTTSRPYTKGLSYSRVSGFQTWPFAGILSDQTHTSGLLLAQRGAENWLLLSLMTTAGWHIKTESIVWAQISMLESEIEDTYVVQWLILSLHLDGFVSFEGLPP